ncbi:MAG: glucoamylase family protein, partial [Nitrospirota bacterium]
FSAANRSRYARLRGSEPGIDPYTCAVSDVYQDLFHEGSFIGKGIYDVKAFERALNNRFPENRILSHDLIEGCYARSGLLSDVQLIEAYPLHYGEDMRRKQRWIRGDWQIVRWLFSFIPGPDGGSQKNPLSVLSQWKIFDNLRRSLVAPALVLLLLISWTAFPFSCGSSLPWTLAVLGIILVPLVVTSITNLFKKSRDMLLFQHLAEIKNSLIRGIAQAGFTIATLPQEAYFHLDAILRTLWRMVITHKRLLEWNPSDHAKNERNIFYAAPIVAAMVLLGNAWSGLPLPFGVGPVIGAWILSPAVAWWISRPRVPRPVRLREDQIRFLRRISRKTWAFFETFVGPEDNWLPPDNYQEYRIATIAHRTSPTNIGLTLLANLAAHDFGYLSIGGFIDRTNNALATMARLERYRGHFYNWYDTKTLQPLHPHYISTVDSGNLASTLLTLRRGLLAFPDIPILGPQTFQGLLDTLLVLAEIEKRVPSLIRQIRKELETQCSEPLATVMEGVRSLDSLIKRSQELVQKIHELRHQSESKAVWWAEAFLRQCKDLQGDMALFVSGTGFDKNTIQTLRALAHLGNPEAIQRITILARCAEQCELFANAEYEFLYDNSSHLLSIGYNASERRRDASYYDLLASEARISCFMAIAQGCLSQESWFSLGRLLTNVGGDPVLLSWSGSMFEYLMPILVMPRYPDTLLDQSYYAAVARQIDYGKQRGVPWGISESCYNLVDAHLNYQYRGFGVPGLGLKRGLSEDLVISPYASALALTIEPEQACKNLERLAEEGIEGPYGFYEAVDYTPSRQRRGQAKTIVRSFMTHHMGMTFLAMTHMLHNQPMQKRFESDPAVQATLLLLQERIPRATALYSYIDETSGEQIAPGREEAAVRFFTTPDTPHPEVHLLSNGKYHVMITNAGGGYSRWHDTAVTRWREDGTSDNGGLFCYIRDVSTGEFWSVAHQPTLKPADVYESIFSGGKAEFRRRDGDIETYTEIAVSPEDDIELRRITLTNRSSKRKEIEITSYAEVVLAPAIADALHQAFNKLFVQTEILPEENALVCTRRPRSAGERVPWMFHLMTADDADIRSPSYETDRMRFIGRENTLVHPQAMNDFKPLSNTQGSVLDPIAAIRFRIVLDPEKPTIINLVTGVAETRDVCLDLIQKYQDRRLAWRVFDLAWTHNQVILHQLNASEPDAQLYGRLAGSILYANAGLRAEPGILIKNQRGQSGLWGYSISGDLPIVLLQISESANIDLARQLVQAHSFWRQKGLAVDLVIWNEDHAGYRQQLQDQIMGLIAGRMETISRDHPGNIFVRSSDQISNEDRILFQSVARIIITDTRGTLQDQLNRRVIQEPPVPSLIPTKSLRIEPRSSSVGPRQDLAFFNGIGGFTPDGREYIITTSRDQKTPLPWVNILANPVFGTVISECGFAYTWGENAHEFRLTPWQNDPVTDASGEACYLRDEETGYVWSPLPQPARGIGPYVTRHGFGYSVFEHDEDGIHSEVQIFVALDAAIKFTKLTIRNNSGRLRRLSATGYVEWVLGDLRPKYAPHIITKIDPGSGALFARNPYHPIFASRVAFFDVDDTIRTITCDRMEFIGRNNTIRNPAALFREELSNRVGPGLDPCSAIQIPFVLENGQEREIIFRLGFGQNEQNAGDLVRRFRGPDAARIALEGVWNYWARTLGAVQVETPDPSVSIAANGWLLYQSLACRVWARSGYYQSGGAYGFRDQLQDVMALIHTEPGMLRSHLLVCASRQFLEGDVQHWWHPPSGQGVRTRCSDDYLWLPLAVCRYVLWTKDTGVLAEMIPFLEGRPLNPDEESWYDHPIRSEQAASLYDHCVLAIKRGLSVGEHGLPLMGSGDWNDGMNNVGIDGKGESVWLGFFLYSILIQFSKIARLHQDAVFADICEEKAEELRQNLEQHGWDGEWYRRAYFDDGMPLGSESNPECKIDSISQSWSVLSGAASPERAAQALEAVNARLVRRNDKLIQLLNPPFDTSDINPGYIKGYVPGVRENGGQYTHAAIWAVMAFAQSGDPVRAWELFNLINPLNHARTREEMETYKVEPYVVAADVYAASAHVGRGGWTWYTGSAGWMYRLIIESLLGLRVEGEKLYFEPCLPPDWESYKIHYRYRETTYHISIVQLHSEVQKMTMIQDGVVRTEQYIILVDDHQEHFVEIKIETK